MKEVPGAICCAFINNHGVGLEENTRTGGAHNVFRFLSLRSLPYSHFGEMYKIVITATTRIRAFSRTNLDFAVTLRNTRYTSRFSHSYNLRLVLIVGFINFIEHFDRITFNHPVEHILDFIGACALMCNDK